MHISPSLAWIRPNWSIDFPKATRSREYFAACSSAFLEPPMQETPRVWRPALSGLNATMWPRPISCRRFSFGMRAFSKNRGTVELPRMPILFSSAPMVNPGVLRSTTKAENLSPSTFAKTMKTSANPPLVIHIFWPLRIQLLPSGERTARVREASESEPACGSDRQYAASNSPVAILGRYFFFCSSVPKLEMGIVPMPVVPPNATAKAAYTLLFAVSPVAATLSSSEPPYASGIPAPSRPISPAFFSSDGIRPSLCFSRSATSGRTSLFTNAVAVWPIRRWSSVTSAGVKTSAGAIDAVKNPPPRTTDCEMAVVATIVPLSAQLLCRALENSRGAHAPADAHRHETVARVTPLEFAQDGCRELGTRAAERMAERNRTAVDIDPRGIESRNLDH